MIIAVVIREHCALYARCTASCVVCQVCGVVRCMPGVRWAAAHSCEYAVGRAACHAARSYRHAALRMRTRAYHSRADRWCPMTRTRYPNSAIRTNVNNGNIPPEARLRTMRQRRRRTELAADCADQLGVKPPRVAPEGVRPVAAAAACARANTARACSCERACASVHVSARARVFM